MAITITHRGTPPKERIYSGRCQNCGTTYECREDDGRLHYGDQREGKFVELCCPVCEATTTAYPKRPSTGASSQWDR